MPGTLFKGIVHGKTIVLEQEPGLPDGQKVSVQVQAVEEPPQWLDRFTVDPSIAAGKLLVKGTRLLAEDLARLIDDSRTDEELRGLHPELTAEHVAALRQYVKVPAGLRRAFGAWAHEAQAVDQFLEEGRRSPNRTRMTRIKPITTD
jgi:uncharacterized protein (DUF433 family)